MKEFIEKREYINEIQLLPQDKIYIVGAGKYGEILGRYFIKNNIKWAGYIDRRKELNKLNGKSVYTYDEVIDGYYIVSTFLYKAEIIEELKNHGIKSDQIITYGNQKVFYEIYEDLIHWEKYTNKLKLFYSKHSEQKCFIIGNGPSLKIEDLEKIPSEYTFASNSIYALYKYTNWRPTYYCAWDPIFCKEMMSEKEKVQHLLQGCQAAFTSILSEGIKYRDSVDMPQIYFIKTSCERSSDGTTLFSEDCSKQVYVDATVTYGMIQLAVYMGFKQIYLLGMDLNYSVERHLDKSLTKRDVCNHMKEIEEEEERFYQAISMRYGETYIADVDMQILNFQSAKRYADSHGIKIYNATRGGKLEVFPRVNFDELF